MEVAGHESNGFADPFDKLTSENVEEELKRLKLIEETYVSDDEQQDRVRLTGQGIDINLLRAGQDIEFELNNPADEEDNYDWSDEIDRKEVSRASLYKYRNRDVIMPTMSDENNNEEEENEEEDENKTPFEILREKMTDVSDEKDEGVMKRILVPGAGPVVPMGARVRVHYNAYFEFNDEPFDSTYLRSRSQEFRLGDGSVVTGLDIAVSTMKKCEKAQFIFEPKYFMGERGCPPRVPGNLPVLFEVELISFVEANDYENYENTPEQQRKKITLTAMLKVCYCLRELGNDNYRRENYKEASKKYRKAIYLLENTRITNDEEEKRWKEVMIKLYLNMSQISLKQVKPKKAIFYCKLVLAFEADNLKAIFRYGAALRMLKDFDRAKLFLQRAYKMSPGNKDIINEIDKLNGEIEKWRLVEGDMYKKMFDSKTTKQPLTIKASTQKKEVKLKENDPNFKTKEHMIKMLNDFAKNDLMKVYNLPGDMYSKDVIDFALDYARSLNLHARNIKGENDSKWKITKNA